MKCDQAFDNRPTRPIGCSTSRFAGRVSNRTASVTQVRQPVYTRSAGRWQNYERELRTLFAALAPLLENGS
jgi:hypothetical protein